jgi:hypothetical protein
MRSKAYRYVIPAVLAAAIPAGVLLAQQPGQQPQPQAQQKRERPARMSPDALGRLQDGRIAMMKEALKLNEAQLKLWAPVEQQLRAGFAARQQARQEREQRREQGAAPSALPDRLDRATERMQKRVQEMQAFNAAFKPFYQSLNEEQKAVAGIVLRGAVGGGRGPRWAHHGPGPGGGPRQ